MGKNPKTSFTTYKLQEYFKNGNIYAADINPKFLFTEDRIKTYLCDQTSPISIQNMFNHPDLANSNFDIIIDDGIHTFDSYITFFRNSIHKLTQHGTYIIEDIHTNQLPAWAQIKNNLENEFRVKIDILNLGDIPYHLPGWWHLAIIRKI